MTATPSPGGLDAHVVVRRGDDLTVDAAIQIDAGESVALLGPNGAGKSTTLWALAGVLPLDEGWVRLGDRVLEDPKQGLLVAAEQRQIGVMFQDYALFPHLDVIDNVAFGPRSRGAPKRIARRRATEWLERLEVGDLADRKPGRLSGGQAQRVALARTLATEPDLLLLDEPLAALDATTRPTLRRVLTTRLDGFAGPSLLVTHDPTEAFLLADRIIVLEEGRVTQTGTPDEIRRHPRTRYAADLAGVNLLSGEAADGIVALGSGDVLHIADHALTGPVLATIHPRSISLHEETPHGSPRNTWRTVVAVVEPMGDRVRVQLGSPLPLTAEITSDARQSLGLEPGSATWVAVKATEIDVQPG